MFVFVVFYELRATAYVKLQSEWFGLDVAVLPLVTRTNGYLVSPPEKRLLVLSAVAAP